MRYKVDQKIVITALNVLAIEQRLYRIFHRVGVKDVKSISKSRASLSFDLTGLSSKLNYKVQAFVWDYGFEREIELNAIGSGDVETVSLSQSRNEDIYIDFDESKKIRDRITELFSEQ